MVIKGSRRDRRLKAPPKQTVQGQKKTSKKRTPLRPGEAMPQGIPIRDPIQYHQISRLDGNSQACANGFIAALTTAFCDSSSLTSGSRTSSQSNPFKDSMYLIGVGEGAENTALIRSTSRLFAF